MNPMVGNAWTFTSTAKTCRIECCTPTLYAGYPHARQPAAPFPDYDVLRRNPAFDALRPSIFHT